MAKIQALYVYPVKSFRGIKVFESMCYAQGLQYDRQWLCIDPNTGKMHTQRTVSKMAQVRCAVDTGALYLQFDSYTFTIPHTLTGDIVQGTVWRDTVPAMVQNPMDDTHSIHLSDALTTFLEKDAQLVKFAPDTVRNVANEDGGVVQFADGYPYTVADVADLNALNDFLLENGQDSVDIERFRANIILANAPADVGSHFDRFTIITADGDKITGKFCTPCTRCPIPDLNPETGEKTDHNLRVSLKKMRNADTHWFSTNSILSLENAVEIKVGDKVDLH